MGLGRGACRCGAGYWCGCFCRQMGDGMRPEDEPSPYARRYPPKRSASAFRTFILTVAMFVWLFACMIGCAALLDALGFDMEAGPVIALWITLFMGLTFAPALFMDESERFSFGNLQRNLDTAGHYISATVKGTFVMVGVVLGAIAFCFVVLGVIGLLLFGFRQVF